MDLDKITVRKIVEESGLSQQTFYNYYKNKEDLVFSVHKVYGQSLIDRLNEDKDYDLNNLLIDNIKFYQEHKQFMLNALKHTKGDNSYFHLSAENAYESLKEYLLKKNNLKRLDKEIDFQLKMYTYASTMMYAYWAEKMPDTGNDEFAEFLKNAMPEKLRNLMNS